MSPLVEQTILLELENKTKNCSIFVRSGFGVAKQYFLSYRPVIQMPCNDVLLSCKSRKTFRADEFFFF